MSKENLRYKEYRQGRRFLVKILPGESLQGSICALLAAEKIESAVVLSGIGSVRNVRLKDIKSGAKLPITPARLVEHEMEGPFELLCITGNIVPCAEGKSDSHLHIMAAKSSGDVIGGHLFDCEVFATCEIVLVEILIDGVERHFSESGGTPTLFFDREA